MAAARHALPAATTGAFGVVLEPHDVDAVRATCRVDRITGLLAGAVRAGEVVIGHDAPAIGLERPADGSDVAASIDGDWYEALHACVVLEALLVRVADRLDAAEIRWRVTKGPAVAHLDFAEPSLRAFGDVDLLIHPDDWDVTVSLLDERSRLQPWHLRYVRRYGKGVTVLIDDMEIDLHRRFAVGRFGIRCRMAECFDGHDRFELAGRSMPAPAAAQRLLHACFHAALGGGRELRAFRDVAEIAVRHPACVEESWEIARRWGVDAVVAAAIAEAWHRLGLTPDHPVVERARTVRTRGADDRALGVFAREDGFRRQALTTLSSLPLRERPRFAATTWMMSRERSR